jgi:hypothetical protein
MLEETGDLQSPPAPSPVTDSPRKERIAPRPATNASTATPKPSNPATEKPSNAATEKPPYTATEQNQKSNPISTDGSNTSPPATVQTPATPDPQVGTPVRQPVQGPLIPVGGSLGHDVNNWSRSR